MEYFRMTRKKETLHLYLIKATNKTRNLSSSISSPNLQLILICKYFLDIVYSLGVLKKFAPGMFWAWEYWSILPPGKYSDLEILKHFESKIKQKKLLKLIKIMTSPYVYFFVLKCSNTPNIYVLFTEMVETFFSRDVTDMRVLAHFGLKRFEPIKSLCAKLFYIFSNIYFGTNVLKKSDKKNC